MKKYEEVMQTLYKEAGKYADQNLAKAVGDVRDMVVELRNMVGTVDNTEELYKEWIVIGYNQETDKEDMLFFDTISDVKKYIKSNRNFIVSKFYHHINDWHCY